MIAGAPKMPLERNCGCEAPQSPGATFGPLKLGHLCLDHWAVMAPMAGITNLPFRVIAGKFGAGLVTTEMVSAAGLVRKQKRTLSYLQTNASEGPLSVQIFGCDPEEMAIAAQIAAEAGAAVVDINMGCPARKVVKNGAGSALLRNMALAERITVAVRRAIDVPLTVKMRSGWSPEEVVVCDFAQMLEGAGADAVTLHPRFASQGFSGTADWRLIQSAVTSVSIPVIGNGDVTSPEMALEMVKSTGCSGVMIGRGAIGNPWIFDGISSLFESGCYRVPSLSERRSLILEHYRLLIDHIGVTIASRVMRGLLLWYTKGLPHSSRFRGVFTGIHDISDIIEGLQFYFDFLREKGY
jgi:tRNA-dihydrouridine synthase B